MKNAIVLAAGKGTRMQSNKNKVMHEILRKPMIGMLVENLKKVDIDKIVVVTGHQKDEIEAYLGDSVDYAVQDEQKGTADAVAKATQLKDDSGSTLILFGDAALIQPDTFTQLFDAHEGHDLTIMSAQVQEPGNYRRIIRDNQGQIDHIVDFRNLTDSERNIQEISLGIFCVNNELLFKYLPEFKDDTNTEEINLTQLVKIMKTNGHKIQSLRAEDYQEFMGVNDRFQLNTSMRWLQERINAQHMYNGVTIISPSDTYIGPDVIIEPDATIYPNTHIYGKSIIRSGATIYPNSWIENTTIGENTTIDSSRITDSTVGAQTTIGPNAHIRMHSDIGNKVRIGNFVEMKNVIFEDLSRSAHLTYLGDAKVGKDVNIGCGVVTANYDGKNKYRTEIGSGSFIGSHSTLIAPVTIGENALVAAASAVSDDVEDGAMAIARTRQETKPGYGERFKNKEGK